MTAQKTLFMAIDYDQHEAFSYIVTHNKGVRVEDAVPKAFKEYAKTDEGKSYIERNGSNWGDALFIPKQFLIKHGVLSVVVNDGHRRVTVDHNELLLED